jgi:hypothetical protein
MLFGSTRWLVRASCFFALLGLAQFSVLARAAEVFGGIYRLSDVIEVGNRVQVTMTLRLLNANKTDVHDAVVAVLSSAPNPVRIAYFPAISTLPRIGEVTVSETFTIPAAEYASWQSGHEPRFQLLLPSDGTTITVVIQSRKAIEGDAS